MALIGAAISRTSRLDPDRVAKGGPFTLVYRNFAAYRRAWIAFLTGFFEPVLYLFSIGVGVGALVTGFDVGGHEIPYTEFVAPAMLATAAMNGAVLDSTFNVFFKLKFLKIYDGVLATPMGTRDVGRGEVGWAVLRGGVYSVAFLVVMLLMGLVGSWWAVFVLPAALLTGFAFSAVGMGLTTFMRSWQDFEYIQLALIPMFLFSATFFPVTTYHGVVRWVVEATPLYRSVVLIRELCTGLITVSSAVSVGYLLVMGLVGMAVVRRRLDRLLLS